MQPQAGRAEKRRAGTCAWHPQERAVLDCARCGAAMCPDCVQTIRGRDLCVDCAHAWRRSRLMAAGVSLMLFVALGLVGVIVLMSTFRTEKHQDQLAITERQVAADPENDVLRMQYVSLLSTAERWEEAISELGRVIQRNPKNQLLYERMVRLCMRARRFEDALSWIERQLKKDPDSVSLLFLEGEAYYGLGQKPAAEQSWLRAYSMAPSNGELALRLADLYVEDMRLADAQAVLAATLERIPDGRLRDLVVLKLAEIRKQVPPASPPQ
ncbi:tetratricopeptide repeat protein [Myxococcota bacterium]|nr:tetratricopeptide repeat protein [Myxococcota bacterium]